MDATVVEHITMLQKALNRVNDDCRIVDFEHEHNYVDFLTVKSFVGSEVGAANLLHPDGWKGPYLRDNFTMQEKQYEVLVNKQGHFVVPGKGVRLGNGNVIGTDIVLNRLSDIKELVTHPGGLQTIDGKALAAQINVQGNPSERVLQHQVTMPT